MALDLILFCILLDSNRPIRPFRIFRALLPVSYDSEMRHSFQALFSAYKDIVVYFCFYAAVFFLFGLVGSQLIDVPT